MKHHSAAAAPASADPTFFSAMFLAPAPVSLTAVRLHLISWSAGFRWMAAPPPQRRWEGSVAPVRALVRAHDITMEGEQTGAEAGRSAALAERSAVAGRY